MIFNALISAWNGTVQPSTSKRTVTFATLECLWTNASRLMMESWFWLVLEKSLVGHFYNPTCCAWLDILLDISSTNGLGCIKGFQWMSDEGKCRPTCEKDTVYWNHNVDILDDVPDLEVCKKHCSTVPEAKFITYRHSDGRCFCVGARGVRDTFGYVTSCPL